MMRGRLQLGTWLTVAMLLGGAAAHGQAKATKQSVVPPATPVQQAPAPQMPQIPGQELDRVVAIVNSDLILDSDVNEELRLGSFQPYGDAAATLQDRDQTTARAKAIERLINRDLILQQAKLQGGEQEVTDQDVAKEIAGLRKDIPACKRYQCETAQGWNRFLADNGFSEAELTKLWKQRMQVLAFIEERFRQGIRITPAEVKTYYDKTLVPQYEKQAVAPPKLETVSVQIQQVLLEQQVSSLLSDWLKSLRAEGQVVVLHPGEAAP
jgi:hypothetical protein